MEPNLPRHGTNGAVAGIGSLVADQLFVEHASGEFHYFVSRGGGSVWNTLGHLALAGYETAAFGVFADDLPGQEALRELDQLGVNTGGLVGTREKHTRVFTQRLSDATKHGSDVPQANFALECPVCEQTIRREDVPHYAAAQYRPDTLKQGPAILCTDRLTADTAETTRAALAAGTVTALDLGGTGGKTARDRREMRERLTHFRIISMPFQVSSWLFEGDVSSLARELVRSGTDLLALTKGAEGFELHLRTESGEPATMAVPAAHVADLTDATGAGDAFLAGMIACALAFGSDKSNSGRLRFSEQSTHQMIDVLNLAPLQTMRGIGARAAFPDYSMGTWAKRLAPLRERTLKDLKIEFGARRPCPFCQYNGGRAD